MQRDVVCLLLADFDTPDAAEEAHLIEKTGGDCTQPPGPAFRPLQLLRAPEDTEAAAVTEVVADLIWATEL